MVIDTSAILAVLFREPERDAFAQAIVEAEQRLVSAVNALECGIVVLARKGPAGLRELDLLLFKGDLDVVAFDSDQVALAREAYERFGKGRHPAKLNFGDCCAYALSRYSGEPLLFKGDDFAQTDVAVACVGSA